MSTIRILLVAVIAALSSNVVYAYDFEVDGIYYNLDSTNKTAMVTYREKYAASYRGTIVIPEAISSNGTHYSVTSIGDNAFSDCSGLTLVIIPNSVTSIGKSAFSNCKELLSVTIPNSVTSIGDYAFYNCSGLTSVTIPNSVTSIGDYAFYNCSGLTSVTIPNSVTSIGNGTFSNCSGLTFVTIPNSTISIGFSAFSGCTRLTLVSIPQKVESVGMSAFSGCTGITTVTIESSETLLEAYAFSECTSIKSVNVFSTLPPIGTDDTFALITYRDATLNVPKTAKDAYTRQTCWRNFRHVEEKDFGGVDDVTADEGGICVNVRDGQVEVSGADASDEIRVYDMNGIEMYRGTDRTIALPTKGVYIVKVAGRTFKVAL